jgi:hypothetical protein
MVKDWSDTPTDGIADRDAEQFLPATPVRSGN